MTNSAIPQCVFRLHGRPGGGEESDYITLFNNAIYSFHYRDEMKFYE
jgi:hypothetical protein